MGLNGCRTDAVRGGPHDVPLPATECVRTTCQAMFLMVWGRLGSGSGFLSDVATCLTVIGPRCEPVSRGGRQVERPQASRPSRQEPPDTERCSCLLCPVCHQKATPGWRRFRGEGGIGSSW